MATQQERQRETVSMGRALGEITPDATPAEEQAYFDSKTDLQIHNMSVELYARMGADGYQPAAA